MAETLLIRSCRLFNRPESEKTDLLIQDGVIRSIRAGLSEAGGKTIDADGLTAAPGLVDMHVHLRDPGFTHKETVETGCRAAAAGGVTAMAAMPNTRPVADTPDIIASLLQKAEGTGIRVFPVGAVTMGQKGRQAVDFDALRAAGAVAFSDDGRPVEKASVLLAAMKAAHRLGAAVISHCEDLSLADGGLVNEGIAARLSVKGIPGAAEEVMVAREVALSAYYRLPVHIAHISTAGSAALIRDAKRRGVPVTCETCPHYFSLTQDLLLSRDADYRMNPPLRSANDADAIAEALQDGTVDVIATDHAPHAPEEKAGFDTAPNGVVGLETSLAAGITFLVKPGRLTLEQLIRKMSEAPARILGIDAGRLEEGSRADIVLFDPDESFVCDPSRLHSKSKNTAFKGMRLNGRVKYTIASGKLVYQDNGR